MRLLLAVLMVALTLDGKVASKNMSTPSATGPIKISGIRVGGDSGLPLLLGIAKNTGTQTYSFFYKVRFLDSSNAVVWTFSSMGGPIGPGDSLRIQENILSHCVGCRPELVEIRLK